VLAVAQAERILCWASPAAVVLFYYLRESSRGARNLRRPWLAPAAGCRLSTDDSAAPTSPRAAPYTFGCGGAALGGGCDVGCLQAWNITPTGTTSVPLPCWRILWGPAPAFGLIDPASRGREHDVPLGSEVVVDAPVRVCMINW